MRKQHTHKPTRYFSALFFFMALLAMNASAQNDYPARGVIVGQLVKTIPSLKNFKPDPNYTPAVTRDQNGLRTKKSWKKTIIDYGSTLGADPVVQRAALQQPGQQPPQQQQQVQQELLTPQTALNFEGQPYTSVAPADPTICAGPANVIQMINSGTGATVAIWDRAGNQVMASTVMSALFSNPGYSGIGDPVALYDQFSDRYFITEFGYSNGVTSYVNTLILAVSQTSDPTGGWYVYKYVYTWFVDYPHFGVWPNALFGTTNDFNTAGTSYLGSSVFAFDKAAMVSGAGSATAIYNRMPLNEEKFGSMAPVNISGTTAPAAGSPGMFVYYSDDNYTASSTDVDSLGFISFTPDFGTPANSVITVSQKLVTAPFKSNLCAGSRSCIPSASGSKYDAISDRVMNRVYYRNFGSYESIVLNYTVDANYPSAPELAGLRWYELRRSSGAWSIYQQSTYAPNTDSRWMGTININGAGEIALAFNLSSASKYASLLYTGRASSDPLNTMTASEQTIINGIAYGTFSNRWGDYNDMAVDVLNDGIFWTDGMYGFGASSWHTRIAAFRLSGTGCPTLTLTPATVPAYSYNVPYSVTFTAGNGTGPYVYSVSGSLPSGLTLNTSTGVLSGTPQDYGNFTFNITAVDNNLCAVTQSYTMNGPAMPAPTTFCNTGSITINDHAAATPYPSAISVSGITNPIYKITVDLKGFTHTYPSDVDILLVGPGGQTAVILSDVGSGTDISNINITLDDAAANSMSTAPLTSGTYKPTNLTSGTADSWPSPAPASPGSSSALSVFKNTTANGTWNLYVVDAATADIGSISSGWCINVYQQAPAVTPIQITCPGTINVNNDAGQCSASVSLTGSNAATATGDPTPTITYKIGATVISSPYNFPVGTTTVTAVASNGVAADQSCTFDVTVTDNEKPVLTCPTNLTTCTNGTGIYNVGQLSATDNCAISSTTYAITGATTRSGTGNDASGTFNTGVSTITWTVTDTHSNSNTCQTTVTIGTPSASIPDVYAVSGQAANTIYTGYGPTSLTLTANASGFTPTSYSWTKDGSPTVIGTSQTLSVSTAGTYYVTIAGGSSCSASASKTINVINIICDTRQGKVYVCQVNKRGVASTNCVKTNQVQNILNQGGSLGPCPVTVTRFSPDANAEELTVSAFSVRVIPNPTNEQFNVTVTSQNSDERILLRVYDVNSKLVQTINTTSGRTVTLGHTLRNGTYILQAVQGKSIKTVKLVKL